MEDKKNIIMDNEEKPRPKPYLNSTEYNKFKRLTRPERGEGKGVKVKFGFNENFLLTKEQIEEEEKLFEKYRKNKEKCENENKDNKTDR